MALSLSPSLYPMKGQDRDLHEEREKTGGHRESRGEVNCAPRKAWTGWGRGLLWLIEKWSVLSFRKHQRRSIALTVTIVAARTNCCQTQMSKTACVDPKLLQVHSLMK